MQDSLLKRVTCSPHTPKALMSSTGVTWEEGAPHTLGCFGVVRPVTGQHDTVFGVHLFTRCNAHARLLRAKEMPSKNYRCQWACHCHDQKRFGATPTDGSYPQPAPLNSATLDWATQGSRKICFFVFIWQLAHLKTSSGFHIYLSPG